MNLIRFLDTFKCNIAPYQPALRSAMSAAKSTKQLVVSCSNRCKKPAMSTFHVTFNVLKTAALVSVRQFCRMRHVKVDISFVVIRLPRYLYRCARLKRSRDMRVVQLRCSACEHDWSKVVSGQLTTTLARWHAKSLSTVGLSFCRMHER